MTEMLPRQRVIAAIDHNEPDRVPTALWGGAYGVVDDLYFQLLNHLNLGNPVQPFRTGHNISYIDDRVLSRLRTDIRYVWPNASPNSPSVQTEDPDMFLDAFGQGWKRSVPYFYADKGILSEATSVDEIDQIVTWPDTSARHWTVGVRERAVFLREHTDYYIVARMIMSHGVFLTACNLRGTAEFMTDMALNEDFASSLLDRVTTTIVGLLKGYLEAAGDCIDMIELPGDDYAANENLLISPAMFQRFIKPALSQVISTIKEHNPDLKIMLHSDGMIERLLPEFIDLGIDVLHPLEPVAALDQVAVKAKYGEQLAFLGGIDISQAMRGSREDVVKEVQQRIAQLAPGGGFILAPSNHLQADVPAENIVTLFEAARQYGVYC